MSVGLDLTRSNCTVQKCELISFGDKSKKSYLVIKLDSSIASGALKAQSVEL